MLGEQEKVFLNVSVINKQESAYETQLFVQMPKQVDYGKLSAVITGVSRICVLSWSYVGEEVRAFA